MKFILQRLYDNGKYTLGFIENEENSFHSFTCEDTFREVKVKGQTRIPAAFYELNINKADTPLTIKHREAYGDWFKYHIQLTNVAGFDGIYIHTGKDQDWTEGCLLLGYDFNLSLPKGNQALTLEATKDFYSIAYPLLDSGAKVFIEIIDNKKQGL
jgi:hypothetical protein